MSTPDRAMRRVGHSPAKWLTRGAATGYSCNRSMLWNYWGRLPPSAAGPPERGGRCRVRSLPGRTEMRGGGVVLAGVDGTDSGRAALQNAAGEAVSAGLRLVALHVRRSPRPLELMAWETYPIAEQWRDELELEAWLQCTLVLADLRVEWEYAVVDGDPAQALCSYAADRSACAVYVGSRIRTRWAARLHRCPAFELQRRSSCRVRVVRFPDLAG
ncbi:MAG: universal stress protein [Actinoallomurus sp.]|jgi:nucleotide-binding universal stress UspA family protein|nr:universal stress protein [Actinoallomurus sp.]